MAWKKVEAGDVWKPVDIGDEIVGTLVLKSEGQFDNKKYIIKTDAGDKIVWGTTVLDDKMSRVQEGQKVKIVFKGTQNSKQGNPTKLFDVYVWSEEEQTDLGVAM